MKIIQVHKILALRGLWQFLLLQSVAVPFFTSRGMDASHIFWLQSLFFATLFFFDVPTSLLTEKVGHRNALVIGSALKGIGGLGLCINSGIAPIYFSYFFIGLGNAFYSGVDSAALYEIFTFKTDKENLLKKIQAISHTITFGAILLSGIVGSTIAHYWGFEILIAINAVFAWSSFLLCLTLNKENKGSNDPKIAKRFAFQTFYHAIDIVVASTRRRLVLVLILAGVVGAVFPYLLQMRFSSTNEEVFSLGILVFIQNAVGVILGIVISKFTDSKSTKVFSNINFIVLSWIATFCFLSFANLPCLIISLILIELVRSSVNVYVTTDFSLSFEDASRQTVSSILSMISRLITVLVTMVLGFAGKQFSVANLCIFLAVLLCSVFLHRSFRSTSPALEINR